METAKVLTPLDSGNILIVGVKASNFDEELRTHPRIIMWDSQQQSWTDKDLPDNTRAVFVTRFIGHAAFGKIMAEARKKRITIFNPLGTGIIAKQVKELLDMNNNVPKVNPIPKTKEPPVLKVDPVLKVKTFGKLKPLIKCIDFTKTNTGNALVLMEKAKEMGIKTTLMSLGQLVSTERRKLKEPRIPTTRVQTLDVSVQILDNMIQELKDMRAFLLETVKENRALRTKMEKFKNWLDA